MEWKTVVACPEKKEHEVLKAEQKHVQQEGEHGKSQSRIQKNRQRGDSPPLDSPDQLGPEEQALLLLGARGLPEEALEPCQWGGNIESIKGEVRNDGQMEAIRLCNHLVQEHQLKGKVEPLNTYSHSNSNDACMHNKHDMNARLRRPKEIHNTQSGYLSPRLCTGASKKTSCIFAHRNGTGQRNSNPCGTARPQRNSPTSLQEPLSMEEEETPDCRREASGSQAREMEGQGDQRRPPCHLQLQAQQNTSWELGRANQGETGTGHTTDHKPLMFLQLTMKGKAALALLDTGSTHTLVSDGLAGDLQLPRTRLRTPAPMLLWNGKYMELKEAVMGEEKDDKKADREASLWKEREEAHELFVQGLQELMEKQAEALVHSYPEKYKNFKTAAMRAHVRRLAALARAQNEERVAILR
ncbi:hypothetical protein Efla_001100 [Eimeria flavescens]